MKLELQTVQFIETVVATAQRVGIEEVVIEKTDDGKVLIRAIDEGKTVAINHRSEPKTPFPFNSIGLSRLNVFASRMQIVKGQKDYSVDVDIHDAEKYVKSFTMKAKGVNVDFRCANPNQIKAPKNINDPLRYLVPLDPDAVVLLQKAKDAMGSDTVTIISNNKGVTFEMFDVNNDKFTHTYAAEVEMLDDSEDAQFVHTYNLKIVLPLFKENQSGFFAVGQRGVIQTELNGLSLRVFNRVG